MDGIGRCYVRAARCADTCIKEYIGKKTPVKPGLIKRMEKLIRKMKIEKSGH